MARIVVTGVTKVHRNGVEALSEVSFEVPDGAFCVLTGPSGSGKSTLLRLMASLEAPTSGMIEIGDAVSQSFRLGRPEVVEFSDGRAFDPKRNIYDNMARGLKSRGLKSREVEAATLRGADALGLGMLMPRKAGEVSAGERAKAALGRAFGHQPRVLLFDEPFEGLCAADRAELRRELRRLQREEGATAVFAINDQTDALALADVLVVMDDGRVVAAGAPDVIYHRPETVEAARLVGAPPMNVLPVRANQTGLSLEDGTHLGGASVMTTATFARLGVRPEHLFVLDGDAFSAAVLPVDVETIESAGHETFLHGRVGSFAVIGRIAGPVTVPADGRVRLGARREHLHMFDAETGERL